MNLQKRPTGAKRSWVGIPFDSRMGEGPGEKDETPEQTEDGFLVLFHGTSKRGAQSIRKELLIRPDNLNSVGLATSPFGARTYAVMKQGPVLRVVLDPAALAGLDAMHEIGGSGRDQLLFQPLMRVGAWPGIPIREAKIYRA
jgi:hypothetical protein